MKDKSIKSIVAIIIFAIIALSTTIVKAVPSTFNWHSDEKGEFATTIVEGMWVMCMEKGGRLKETTYEGGEIVKAEKCARCLDLKGSEKGIPLMDKAFMIWPGEDSYSGKGFKYQSEFTLKEQKDATKYQDVLYVLKNTDDIDIAQRILWVLDINEGRHLGKDSLKNDIEKELYDEAVEYKKYYEEKVKYAGNEFTTKDVTDLNKVKVSVNKNDNTYTVGPFAVSYLDNYYENADRTKRINFGEITNLVVKNEKEEMLDLVDIQDEKGNSISKRTYKYPQKEEKFFVKFQASKPSKSISLDINFSYFKGYKGTLYEYEGQVYQWSWLKEKTSECDVQHVAESTGNIINNQPRYTYSLKRRAISKAQKLLAYGMDIEEERGTTTLTIAKDIPPEPEEPKEPMIYIYKQCETKGEPLYGAEFNIALTIKAQYFNGIRDLVITLGKKTDDQGIAKITTQDIEQYFSIGKFTGNIDVEIKETKAPEGHRIKNETTTMNITLNKGEITNCTGSSKTEIDKDIGGKSIAKITVYNDELPPPTEEKQSMIYIYKESSDNTQALFGAEFEITLAISGKELKFSRTTDTNGLARITSEEIKERGVDLGNYSGIIDVTLKETKPPENYKIATEISTMKLTLNNGKITNCTGSSTTNLREDAKGDSIAKITIYNAKNPPPPGIDITMEISGKVFLDKDEGKINEGNNYFNDGEGLEGIEVTLYEINNNKAELTQNVMHTHIGNSSQYGGCYKEPVYHYHSGSETVRSNCYNQATHTHNGSAELDERRTRNMF